MTNLSWQTEHQTSAQTVFTTEFLTEKFGLMTGKYFPISELDKYISENNKPGKVGQEHELVITDLGSDSRPKTANNFNPNNFLSQITVGNLKTIGSGSTKKISKQNAAQAMLICLKNNGKGGQVMKFNETEAGNKNSGWGKKKVEIFVEIPSAVESELVPPVINNGPHAGWRTQNRTNSGYTLGKNTVKPVTAGKTAAITPKTKQTTAITPELNTWATLDDEVTETASNTPPKVIKIEDSDSNFIPISETEAGIMTQQVIKTKNPVAYCNEACQIVGAKLNWNFKESAVGKNKPIFACTGIFGKIEVEMSALNKKEAKTKAATALVRQIFMFYGDVDEIKSRSKSGKKRSGGGQGWGGKRKK